MFNYEVYAYLDPRKPGNYKYGNYVFDFLPVYIGKGNIQQNRKYKHLNKSCNRHLSNFLKSIINAGINPIIRSIYNNITESVALTKEVELIQLIGRKNIKKGPLYNFTDGGEGMSGMIYSSIQKKQRSERCKAYFASLTPEQLKFHGQKSLRNRNPNNIKFGIEKAKQTKHSKSAHVKQQIEQKRRINWEQKYYNRSEIEKQQTSIKCSIASKRKKSYFITIKFLDTGEIISDFLPILITRYGFARDGIMYRIKSNNIQKPLYSRTVKKTIVIISYCKKPQL